MKLIKENEKGKVYQTENFKIVYRKKDTISGDNEENVEELIYLVHGSAEVTLKDKTWTAKAPAKIEFPAKTYHKIKALTDICFILIEK
jgi:mannose-6-phosphate isomerase-like protein (cupin superfamily)